MDRKNSFSDSSMLVCWLFDFSLLITVHFLGVRGNALRALKSPCYFTNGEILTEILL